MTLKLKELSMLDFIGVVIIIFITDSVGHFLVRFITSVNENLINPLLKFVVPDQWWDNMKITLKQRGQKDQIIDLGKFLEDITMVLFALITIYAVFKLFYKEGIGQIKKL